MINSLPRTTVWALLIQRLGIDSRLISEVGRISNKPTIQEARHPGKHLGKLRPATVEERRLVHDTTRDLLARYIHSS